MYQKLFETYNELYGDAQSETGSFLGSKYGKGVLFPARGILKGYLFWERYVKGVPFLGLMACERVPIFKM